MQVVLCLYEKFEKLLVLVQGPLLIVSNLLVLGISKEYLCYCL